MREKMGFFLRSLDLLVVLEHPTQKKGPTKLGAATLLVSSDAYCCVVVVCWTNSKLIGVT
jgi:hypothetical protein